MPGPLAQRSSQHSTGLGDDKTAASAGDVRHLSQPAKAMVRIEVN